MTEIVESWPEWVNDNEIKIDPKALKRLEIFTTSNRATARLAAVQCFYSFLQSEVTNPEHALNEWREMYRDRPLLTDDDSIAPKKGQTAILIAVVMGVSLEREALTDLLTAALPPEKPPEKLEVVLQCILLCGAYELLRSEAVPANVILNEYLNIAHLYYDKETVALVNGVLDAVSKTLRS